MVLVTALIRDLAARFGCDVDVLTSGPWSEPLLRGQPGVGEILTVRSRKTPYWLSSDQQRAVSRLRARGVGPTWYCDGNDSARPMLTRAGIGEEFIVDAKDHPLLPGEHVTQQWRRLAKILPAAASAAAGAAASATASLSMSLPENLPVSVPEGVSASVPVGILVGVPEGVQGLNVEAEAGGCRLDVSAAGRTDLDAFLRARRLQSAPLIAIQIGNKRTMRRGLKRLAPNSKHWPNERWAAVLRHVRASNPTHTIVLLGTGPEAMLNQEIIALAGIDRIYNLADDLPVPRLVALLAHVQGLITVDSGPAHAAAAVGCPLVVLFGKASVALYRPWGKAGADVKVLEGRVGGEPDMLGIEVRDVAAAWDGLTLRAARGPALSPAAYPASPTRRRSW
jgi:heptosyltransferase-2/heptosyltransferase-3